MNPALRPWIVAALLVLAAFLPAPLDAGMTPEEVKAFDGYKAKADNGDVTAQFELGLCYYYGKGVKEERTQAVFWYRKAAYLGSPQAQYQLGVCYYFGSGIPKDQIEGYAFMNLAGASWGEARKTLDYLERELLPEVRLKGQERARELEKLIPSKNTGK